MTKRKSTPEVIEALEDDRLDVDHIDKEIFEEMGKVLSPVVALTDQMDMARQHLYSMARSGKENAPVPDVMARALVGTDDVLLTVWRAWDIYATLTDDKWMIRADQVR